MAQVKKEAKKINKKVKKKKPGFFKRIFAFIKSVWRELKKVTWPARKELIQHTSVVFGIVLIVTLLIWIMDTGLGAFVALILG